MNLINYYGAIATLSIAQTMANWAGELNSELYLDIQPYTFCKITAFAIGPTILRRHHEDYE